MRMISMGAGSNIRLNPVAVAVCAAIGLCWVIYLFGLPDWFQREEKINMKELLSVCIELAKRGGTRVRKIREDNTLAEKVKGKTKEGADEMLTMGDTESHRAIVYGLLKTYPGLKVVSEETDLKPVNFKAIPDINTKNEEVERIVTSDTAVPFSKITVWVDPLDATQEYTENLLHYVTVMVCVAVNGQPTIGVIHKPFQDETAWAWAQNGHSGNLKPAPEKDKNKDYPYKIIVSRSHSGTVERVARDNFGNKTNVIPAGGAGFKTLEVVKGFADAYIHVTKIKKWDICAGNAILSALGGKMTTLEGNYIDYSSSDSVKNEEGLLATLYNHFYYLEKLKETAEEMKNEQSQVKHEAKDKNQEQSRSNF